MPLLRDLTDDIVSALTGYTTDLPMRGTLTADMTAGALTATIRFPVAEQSPAGYVEIGSELVAVQDYDPGSGTLTIPAWGRGQQGSSAVTHTAGDLVTVNPRFPRAVVRRRINEAVQSMCPPLFGVTAVPEFRVEYGTNFYPLPSGAYRILRLEYRYSEIQDWQQLVQYEVRSETNELWLPERYCRYQVRGIVAINPGQLTAESNDYAAVTGLANSTADIVHNYVVARLVLGGDLARQQVGTVETSNRNREINSGSGAAIARFHMALNEQRLAAETTRLQQMYPPILRRKG